MDDRSHGGGGGGQPAGFRVHALPYGREIGQALHIGVPLVVAFHLFRVVVVNMGAQYIYSLAMWARGRMRPAPAGNKEKKP